MDDGVLFVVDLGVGLVDFFICPDARGEEVEAFVWAGEVGAEAEAQVVTSASDEVLDRLLIFLDIFPSRSEICTSVSEHVLLHRSDLGCYVLTSSSRLDIHIKVLQSLLCDLHTLLRPNIGNL